MRRTVLLFALLVAILAPAVATYAQTLANPGTYTVQPGDTGWALAGRYYSDSTTWQRIVDMNPFLQERGRVFEDTNPVTGEKRIILLLKPGEALQGLERLNINPPTAVPIEKLVAPAAQVAANPNFGSSKPFLANVYGWLLLALAIALGIWLIVDMISRHRSRVRHAARESELRRDPITSGPAMVPGGIPATDAPRLTNFFDQQAVNRYAQLNPAVDRATIRATRIGPIEEGTITGEGMVGYLGGDFRPRRIDTPLAAYQARYHFPDGTEENMITLQACMNPVTYGGDTYRGFTFVARTAVVPVPEPERPAPQPAQHPALAVRAIVASAQREGHNTITLGDDVMEFPRGYHVVVNRETGEITLNANAFEMKVNPKRIKRVRPETPRSTGTTGDN